MFEHASSSPGNFALVEIVFPRHFHIFCGAKVYSSRLNYGKNDLRGHVCVPVHVTPAFYFY